jgi:hypothetical protein
MVDALIDRGIKIAPYFSAFTRYCSLTAQFGTVTISAADSRIEMGKRLIRNFIL